MTALEPGQHDPLCPTSAVPVDLQRYATHVCRCRLIARVVERERAARDRKWIRALADICATWEDVGVGIVIRRQAAAGALAGDDVDRFFAWAESVAGGPARAARPAEGTPE